MATTKKRSRTPGSIYQGKDGRWVAALVVGHDDAGKMVRKRAYAHTADDAKTKLLELQGQYKPGALKPTKGRMPTLATYAASWLDGLELRPNTTRRYRELLNLHILPALGRHQLDKLEPDHVRAFMRETHRKAGVTARTVNHCRAVLRQVLNGAIADRKLTVNVAATPFVKPLKLSDSKPALVLSRASWPAFEAMCAEHRDGPLWLFLLGVGCRTGEAYGLTWADVEGDTVRIERELIRVEDDGTWKYVLMQPKTAEKAPDKAMRTVVVPALVVDALKRQRAQQDAEKAEAKTWSVEYGHRVFTAAQGRPLNGPAAEHRFVKAQMKAGMRPVIRLHDLRHTMVSWTAGEGIDPKVTSVVVGHSRPSTTTDVYTSRTLEMSRLVADAMDRATSG